jgi:hypothetical protein
MNKNKNKERKKEKQDRKKDRKSRQKKREKIICTHRDKCATDSTLTQLFHLDGLRDKKG